MRVGITGLVALHALVTAWHAYAHAGLAVTLSPREDAFVYVVIVLAPVVAGLLVWTRYAKIATWVFFLSMLASFLFGAFHHFVTVSADHVLHLPSGSPHDRSAFVASAVALAVLELGSALYGAASLRARREPASVGVGS